MGRDGGLFLVIDAPRHPLFDANVPRPATDEPRHVKRNGHLKSPNCHLKRGAYRAIVEPNQPKEAFPSGIMAEEGLSSAAAGGCMRTVTRGTVGRRGAIALAAVIVAATALSSSLLSQVARATHDGDKILEPGETLSPGESIKSPNNQYTLIMQTDGNLVAYAPGGVPIWASLWAGAANIAGSYAAMQTDGNFVVYSWNGAPLYHTGTYVPLDPDGPGTRVTINDAGQVNVMNSAFNPDKSIWTNHPDNMFPTPAYSGCSTTKFCQSESWYVTWGYESSVGSAAVTTISSFIDCCLEPLDLSFAWQSPIVYTGVVETDIVYRRQDIPGSAVGTALCDNPINSVTCDQTYVTFENSSPSGGLICHETGHALGLTHGEQASPHTYLNDGNLGCMGGSGQMDLRQHNQWILNQTY